MGRCPLLIILIVQVAIILVADRVGWRAPQQPPAFKTAEYAGIIRDAADASTSGQLLIVRIDSVESAQVNPFLTRLHIVSEYPQFFKGQRIRFRTKPSLLQPLPDVPDIVDLQKNLRRRGVVATAAAPVDSIVYIASANKVEEWFAKANERLFIRLANTPLDNRTISILAALLLGRGEHIDDISRADYSAAGISHVLALSGMHVAVIATIIALALLPLYLGRHVRTRLLITIAALWFYAALTGFIPSVTRAVIMASVYMFGRIIQRKSASMNSLCLAAILILLISPEELYAVGFQLSFAAVAGIILFYPLINRVNHKEHPLLYNVASYPALSVSAMSLAGIVSVFHFHTFPLYFIVANLLIAPIVPLLIFSGVVSMIFRADVGADFLTDVLDKIAVWTARLPYASIDNLYPPAWLALLLGALLAGFAVATRCKNRFCGILTAMLFVGTICCYAAAPRKPYPAVEQYVSAESRSTQIIVSRNDSCIVYTTAKAASDREEILSRYQLLLRDFVGKRKLQGPFIIEHKTDD